MARSGLRQLRSRLEAGELGHDAGTALLAADVDA
jgi:hypothetical protein